MYAKLVDDLLEFAPQNCGAIVNYNTNEDLMRADGYKLFVEAQKPITNRKYHIEYNELPSVIQEVIVYDETQEEADEREKQEADAEFNRQFFLTSLGYVRRTVHLLNGTTCQFLTDVLPLLQVGVPVIVYTRELEQNKVPATAEFIQECGQQMLHDFYGE